MRLTGDRLAVFGQLCRVRPVRFRAGSRDAGRAH